MSLLINQRDFWINQFVQNIWCQPACFPYENKLRPSNYKVNGMSKYKWNYASPLSVFHFQFYSLHTHIHTHTHTHTHSSLPINPHPLKLPSLMHFTLRHLIHLANNLLSLLDLHHMGVTCINQLTNDLALWPLRQWGSELAGFNFE